MPVRVKQRAVISSLRLNVDREWTRLVAEMVATLLSWTSATTISLRGATWQREVLLVAPDAADLVSRTSKLLNQAAFTGTTHETSWMPVSASAGHITVKGCIATEPVATSRAQFISIGINPLMNEHGNNVVYQEVNKVFRNSSFGTFDTGARGGADEDHVQAPDTRSRRGVERWPMFYFRIRIRNSVPSHELDGILENRKNDLTGILDLLKAVSYGFLRKQHLRPRKVRMSSEDSVFSKSKSRSRASVTKRPIHPSSSRKDGPSASPRLQDLETRTGSPFDSWQRIKVGNDAKQQHKQKDERIGSGHINRSVGRLIGEGGRLLRQPFDDFEDGEGGRETSVHFLTRDHPSNSTGVTHEEQELEASPPGPARGAKNKWLDEVLKSWNNPIFENTPRAIPRAYGDSQMSSGDRHSTSMGCEVMFEAKSMGMDGRISKAALGDAEIIGQVDRKFILVKLQLDSAKNLEQRGTPSLVVLDQHAVDERCQLEELMGNFFARDSGRGVWVAQTERLEPSIKFEADPREVSLLNEHRQWFHTWGITLYLRTGRVTSGELPGQVEVTHLPPSILERCRTEPRLLIDLLREEAWKLAEGGGAPTSPSSLGVAGTDDSWTTRFHGCPHGILELLHSRSCRSAVMFNDVLTRADCEAMVKRVAACAFPFQCAHGRPSMVPLVDLGIENGSKDGWMPERPDWMNWAAIQDVE